jgi:hypothetical protein
LKLGNISWIIVLIIANCQVVRNEGWRILFGYLWLWVSPVSLLFVGTVMASLALQDFPGDFEKPRLEGLDIHRH